MLIVYTNECDVVVELSHQTWIVSLHQLELTSESWHSAEDVPQELFFMSRTDHTGRVMEVIQRDENQTIYEDKNKEINLVIETPID